MRDWNEELRQSIGTPEVPGGRGRNRKGLIPSTPQSAAASTDAVSLFKMGLAHDSMVAENIQNHRETRRQKKQSMINDAEINHAYETANRHAKHAARATRRRNRSDLLLILGMLVFVSMCCLFVFGLVGLQ